MSSSKAFLSAVAARRSYYKISNKSLIDRNAIKDIIDQAVKYTPSAFNSQGGRVVLVLDEAHSQLWHMVKHHLLNWVPKGDAVQAKTFSDKVMSFVEGYGTVLFFEDQDTIAASYERSPQ